MRHISFPLYAAALAVPSLLACNASPTADSQVVSGRAELGSFPTTVSEVQAFNDLAKVVATGRLASDGTFSIDIPRGQRYGLRFAGDSRVPLVFPRASGGIDATFDIRAGDAPFDLGTVRYIGDPTTQMFTFGGGSRGDQGAPDEGSECEDGFDTQTGAVCVDDGEEAAGSCSDGEENDGDSVDCVDGIDPATGQECDGGPTTNDGTDGEDPTDDNGTDCEDPTDDAPSAAAVADHNLPSALGCAEQSDTVDCQDGIDPATGQECDGGPAANGDGAE